MTDVRGGAEQLGGITFVECRGQDFTLPDRLGWEREVLRRTVSASPLDDWHHELKAETFATLDMVLEADSTSLRDGTMVTVAGAFDLLFRRVMGKRIFASGQFMDLARVIDVMIYTEVYTKYRSALACNVPMVIDGYAKRSDDRPVTLVLQSVRVLEKHPDGCGCVEERAAASSGRSEARPDGLPDVEPVYDIEVTENALANLRELAAFQREGLI